MEDFTRKLVTEWRALKLPFEGERIIVAVSGGTDSCALATAVAELVKRNKLRNRFFITHFNHGLRGSEGDRDARFVEGFAKKLGFEFISGLAEKGQINLNDSIEQSARKARYAFFLEMAKEKKIHSILTAHTVNDQAETFLINLIRGSGIEGLAGMNPVREFGSGRFDQDRSNGRLSTLLARPLLRWAKREDTERFIANHNIPVCHDSMNDESKFTRVRIRKELIPLMKGFNPNMVGTLAKTSELLRRDSELLADYEQKYITGAFENDSELAIRGLLAVSGGAVCRIIRFWLKEQRGNLRNLDNKHIEAIAALVTSKKSGRVIELPGGESVVKRDGKLAFRAFPRAGG